MTDFTKPIKADGLKPDEIYTAQITFRSQGESGNCTIDYDFSHEFSDDYDGPLPGAALLLRDIGLWLARQTVVYANTEIEDEYIDSKSIDPEEKARTILEYAQAQDDAKKGRVH